MTSDIASNVIMFKEKLKMYITKNVEINDDGIATNTIREFLILCRKTALQMPQAKSLKGDLF